MESERVAEFPGWGNEKVKELRWEIAIEKVGESKIQYRVETLFGTKPWDGISSKIKIPLAGDHNFRINLWINLRENNKLTMSEGFSGLFAYHHWFDDNY